LARDAEDAEISFFPLLLRGAAMKKYATLLAKVSSDKRSAVAIVLLLDKAENYSFPASQWKAMKKISLCVLGASAVKKTRLTDRVY
jgi:hypothetical protein